jgi:hypothetical protein
VQCAILFSIEQTWKMPSMPRRRRGSLLQPLLGVAKRLWKLATDDFDWRRQEAEGVIDLAGRRYILDCGSHARLYAEGNSGMAAPSIHAATRARRRARATLAARPCCSASRMLRTSALTMCVVPHVATSVRPPTLSKASREVPGGVAVPTRIALRICWRCPLRFGSTTPTSGGCTLTASTALRPLNCGISGSPWMAWTGRGCRPSALLRRPRCWRAAADFLADVVRDRFRVVTSVSAIERPTAETDTPCERRLGVGGDEHPMREGRGA